jgi:hypothetical protein
MGSATAGSTGLAEVTSRSVAGGWVAGAHSTPQRQQVPAPFAIGAWHSRHVRGTWRLRMGQPAGVVGGAGTV